MKRLACIVLAALALAPSVFAASTGYTNNGNITAPPQQSIPVIDATNFLNNGYFSVSPGTYYNSFYLQATEPFDFSSVQNYTNKGTLICPSGFRFDTAVPNYAASGYLTRTRARYWVNGDNSFNPTNPSASSALVAIGTGGNLAQPFPAIPYSSIEINATNVINRGQILVPSSGYLEVFGDYIDFSRSLSQVSSIGLQEGFTSTFWGKTNAQRTFTADNLPGTAFLPAVPLIGGTNFILINGVGYYGVGSFAWPQNPLPGSLVRTQFIHIDIPTTNKMVQVVFVHNVNTNIGVQIAGVPTAAAAGNNFLLSREFSQLQVLLTGVGTNSADRRVTNSILIVDSLGSDPSTITNNFYTNTALFGGLTYRPTSQPPNYLINRFTTNATTLASVLINPVGTLFDPTMAPYNGASTNNILSTNSSPPSVPQLTIVSNYISRGFALNVTNLVSLPTPPSNIRDLVGSLRIEADKALDLNYARLDSLDYLKLQGAHFLGSTNALIGAPFIDVNLGSTNGSLTLSNLLRPSLPQLNGTISMVSLIWTNFQAYRGGGDTNAYPVPTHVLFVEANLQTTFANRVLSMSLNCTNVAGGTNTINIGDTFFVMEGFKLDSDILNIFPTGNLDFQQNDFNWVDQMPNLRSLTNNGRITATNTAVGLYFTGRDPNTGLERSLLNFVNGTNGILNYNGGVVIHALNVRNGGSIASTNAYGPIYIDATNVALLPGGSISSRGGDVFINTGTLIATNHQIIADRALSLSITNSLLANTNTWLCADGFNLFVKPTTGDFNAVSVTSIARDYAEVFHNWAGLDVGAVAAGFTNNAAVGNLILDGGLFSRFTFQPVAAANAIYIDRLDLRNSATNTDLATNYTGVDIKPGFKIYYANAFAGAADISVSLNGKYGVNGAAGGQFIRIIHSGGVYNKQFGGSTIGSFTGSSGLELAIDPALDYTVSWNSVAGALNQVYYKHALSDSDWQLVQSFISTHTGRTAITNPVGSDGGFYKVEVNLLP